MTLRAHLGEGADIYPTLEPGYTLIVSDGAYGIGGFPGDPTDPCRLAEWYAPHLEAWDRLAAPSSSLYFWCTPKGCARMLPHVEAAGWTLRNQIRWSKGMAALAGRLDTASLRGWPEAAEDCYFFVREGLAPIGGPAQFVAYAAGASERNTIRVWLNEERARAGLPMAALHSAITDVGGKGEMICRHSFAESQWCLPTWDQWKALHRAWNLRGILEGRPYLQRNRSRVYDLNEPAEYDALRAEYDALRYPFQAPPGLTDTWDGPPVSRTGRHSCAKRDDHIERIVLASSRPGDRVLEPFGGGAPVLRACRKLGRSCDSIERDPEWHACALASLETRPDVTATATQPSLWAR